MDLGAMLGNLGGMTPGGLALLALALAASGFAMGFVAGLFGIGGGAVLVPVLFAAFPIVGVEPALVMQMCLGTALAVMVPTTISSFRSHLAKGTVDTALLRRIAPWIVVGVVLGAMIAKYSTGRTLMGIWALAGFLLAGRMALGRDDWQLGDDLPNNPVVEIYAVLTGLLSTLMSTGGSAFLVTLMSLYGRPLLQSVSTGSGLGPLIAIPGTIGFVWAGWGMPGRPPLSLGYVSLVGAALIIPVSVYAAPIGVRLAHRAPKRTLELSFAAFLGTMSARFLWGWLF